MGEEMFSKLKACSEGTKQRLSLFFQTLTEPDRAEINTVERQL